MHIVQLLHIFSEASMPYNEGCGGLCGGVRASCPYKRNLAMIYSNV